MVGMRDVARKAGVSLSTVSLVVNGNGYVSTEMRARVTAAMKSLNYVPNELARNLYHDRTNMVGVIVPTIRHPFFATLVAGLQGRLFDAGYRTIVCSTADMGSGEDQYVDMLRRHMMDGLIMVGHTTHPADYWTSIRRPIVAFDRYLGASIPSIGSDHEQGGELAATMFALTGVRNVVEIGGPRSQYNDLPSAEITGEHTTFPPVRYHLAFEHTLDMAGIRWNYLEVPDVSDFATYEAVAREAFERFPEADAIMAPDMAAAFCVQEALRRGMRVPDHMQIMAYDGTYVTDLAGMRITSILQDFTALTGVVAQRMIAEMHGDDTAENAQGPAGVVADLVPMRVKLGETTRMNDAVHQLLFGPDTTPAQTD